MNINLRNQKHILGIKTNRKKSKTIEQKANSPFLLKHEKNIKTELTSFSSNYQNKSVETATIERENRFNETDINPIVKQICTK